jgi:hypothetical protein
MVAEIDWYGHTLPIERHRRFETIYIGWKHPWGEWIKLNCDGAYNESMGVAGVGVFFETHMVAGWKDILKRLELVMSSIKWDSTDYWLKGYTQSIGTSDVLHP